MGLEFFDYVNKVIECFYAGTIYKIQNLQIKINQWNKQTFEWFDKPMSFKIKA